MNKLNIAASGNEYIFSENQDLVQFLQNRYPNMSFDVPLSLSAWQELRNLHKLTVSCPIVEGMNYDSVQIQSALVDGLLNFLDLVSMDMNAKNIKNAGVKLSRIEMGTTTSSVSLKTELYAHLRAVFTQE